MRKVVCALLTSAILITGVPGYHVQGVILGYSC